MTGGKGVFFWRKPTKKGKGDEEDTKKRINGRLNKVFQTGQRIGTRCHPLQKRIKDVGGEKGPSMGRITGGPKSKDQKKRGRPKGTYQSGGFRDVGVVSHQRTIRRRKKGFIQNLGSTVTGDHVGVTGGKILPQRGGLLGKTLGKAQRKKSGNGKSTDFFAQREKKKFEKKERSVKSSTSGKEEGLEGKRKGLEKEKSNEELGTSKGAVVERALNPVSPRKMKWKEKKKTLVERRGDGREKFKEGYQLRGHPLGWPPISLRKGS